MKVEEGLFLVAIYFSLAYTQLLVKGQPQPRQDCPKRCGDVAIEYPFGISSGCYYPGDDSFNITCKEDRPYVLRGIEVKNFYHNGQLRVMLHPSSVCFDEQGNETISHYSNFTLDNLSLSAKNKFTLVGCNALALLYASGKRNYSTGCISACVSPPAADEKCKGAGCCISDVSFPLDSYTFQAVLIHIPNLTSLHQINPCTYAFLVEDGEFDFQALEDLKDLQNVTEFPVVLDWSIGNQTCKQVGNTRICGANSTCSNSTTRNGYICKCFKGFHKNPYLSAGCQDIDECTNTVHKHNCSDQDTCRNKDGGFDCKCQSGYRLDTTTMSCKRNLPKDLGWARWAIIPLGTTTGFLVILLGVCFTKQRRRRRKVRNI